MFADVILPLPLPGIATFTYAVPGSMQMQVRAGFRVIVPFGARKYYTAIVLRVHNNAPKGVEVKEIYAMLDSFAVATPVQLEFWQWLSFYYIVPLGDVYKAALPAMMKLESETMVSPCPNIEAELEQLSETERKIIGSFADDKPIKISDIAKSIRAKNILPAIYSLVQQNLINTQEALQQRYTPKTENHITINPDIDPDSAAAMIGRAPRQLQLLQQINNLLLETGASSIARKTLLETTGASSAALTALIDKNILIQSAEKISRIDSSSITPTRQPFKLSDAQQAALDAINNGFAQKEVCLLHGVTSSGKTEIYIHLINQYLAQGKQALYLVPEIALTTQLMQRLREVFGSRLGVYHSKVGDSERTEIWLKMMSDSPYDIIIGVRSSLFLPFVNIGLIIVDEEHENSYKQHDPSPRYHARDAAVMMARLAKAKTLLGSATPSFESYFNTQNGKYALATINTRFEDVELPLIQFENTYELRRTRKMKSVFAPALIKAIKEAMDRGEQIVLFRNRRGFAPMIECKMCAWTPKCRRCDVALTYHKFRNELKCHYCNATYSLPGQCPSCSSQQLEFVGQGTEQIEEAVKLLFPDATTARMDTDTMQGRDSYQKTISAFRDNKINILIGTQMLSKGLDFDNVSVVGIIAADGLLNHPDFRSYERGFQMMMQTGGRAGRRNKRGTVIIQTSDPEQPVYTFVRNNDYAGFFAQQMAERKYFNYPPYYRLIDITIKHKNESVAQNATQFMADLLRAHLAQRVFGPVKPVVSKVQLYHIRTILIKIETSLSPATVRQVILQSEQTLRANTDYRYVVLQYDVDPA